MENHKEICLYANIVLKLKLNSVDHSMIRDWQTVVKTIYTNTFSYI